MIALPALLLECPDRLSCLLDRPERTLLCPRRVADKAIVLRRMLLMSTDACRTSSHMLQRNLLYTGVTRGRKLVVLVGQKKAVAIAVRNASGGRRWSKLGEWLSQHIR